MSAANTLPLPLGILLFETKVENSLRFGRWLWGIHTEARAALDEAYSTWARAFLSSASWRNCNVALAEMGWFMSGSGRCVLDVALQLARLWRAGSFSLAGTFLISSLDSNGSWSNTATRLLSEWGVLDWPSWCALTAQPSAITYKTYCTDVIFAKCKAEWLLRISVHTAPSAYPITIGSPLDTLSQGLSWRSLLQYRALARFRAGLQSWGHMDYAHSQAKVQRCIGCDKLYTGKPHSVFLLFFCHPRGLLEAALSKPVSIEDVWLPADGEFFVEVLSFVDCLDTWHHIFWKRDG